MGGGGQCAGGYLIAFNRNSSEQTMGKYLLGKYLPPPLVLFFCSLMVVGVVGAI